MKSFSDFRRNRLLLFACYESSVQCCVSIIFSLAFPFPEWERKSEKDFDIAEVNEENIMAIIYKQQNGHFYANPTEMIIRWDCVNLYRFVFIYPKCWFVSFCFWLLCLGVYYPFQLSVRSFVAHCIYIFISVLVCFLYLFFLVGKETVKCVEKKTHTHTHWNDICS